MAVKLLILSLYLYPNGSDNKESACNAGDLGLIPVSGRSPGEGNGNPLQYACLGESHQGLQSMEMQKAGHNSDEARHSQNPASESGPQNHLTGPTLT